MLSDKEDAASNFAELAVLILVVMEDALWQGEVSPIDDELKES